MACSNNITANIVFSCDDLPIKGLEGGEALILNWEQIDRSATTAVGAKLDTVAMKSGFQAWTINWYKELASTATALSRNAEDVDGFMHSFLARLATTSTANADIANELKNGRFVVIVKTSYTGAAGAEKYKVYGFDSGLELSELAGNSNENSSSLLFTLSTREGTYEQYPYNILNAGTEVASDGIYDGLTTPAI